MGLDRKLVRARRSMMSKESKYIVVPDEVVVVNPLTKKPLQTLKLDSKGRPVTDSSGEPTNEIVDDDPWTMYRTLLIWVFQKDGWDKPLSRQRTRMRVLNAFDGIDDGSIVKVRGEDWQAVKDFLEDEEFELGMPYGPQLMVMLDAWLDATAKDLTRKAISEESAA